MSELDHNCMQLVIERFKALDRNGSGYLTEEELSRGMKEANVNFTPQEIEQIFLALDQTGSRRIGYREFIAALAHKRTKIDRRQLRDCFDKFDINKSGKITF